MASFSEFFLGKPEQMQSISTLNPQQQQLLASLLGGLGGPLGQAFGNISQTLSGSPEAFRDFERPTLTQFQQEILPMLSEGFGGVGAGRSSGAQQTFARAGERLSEQLGAQRAGLQQNAISQLMGFLNPALSPSQQTMFRPETYGFLGQLGSGVGQSLGSLGPLGLMKKMGLF